MYITQSKPFDEIMFDERTSATTATSNCTGTPKTQSRLVSMPYDEERAMPVTISPCSTEGSTTPMFSCITNNFRDIESDYLVDPTVLGTGHHGSVRQCIHIATGKKYAVKSICKSAPTVHMKGIAREISLLNEMKHRSIIQLVDVYEDEGYVHLITDLCEGSELFNRIVQKSNAPGVGCFSEEEAAKILYQILNAVEYMHQQNVAHRDIKPENILFETNEEDSPIKIIDFGLARKHFGDHGEMPMSTVVGTPYYIAPDVLSKSYDKSCDLWSVGVIAYILLAGYPPFNGHNNKEVYAAVQKGTYYFPREDWKDISVGARDFVVKLMQTDPNQRMKVDQALRHPWLVKHIHLEESRDAVEVVYDRSSKKDSVLFRGRALFRPRVKIL